MIPRLLSGKPYLFLPGEQNAVVDGNLSLEGDLVEVRACIFSRGRVPAYILVDEEHGGTMGAPRGLRQRRRAKSNTRSCSSLSLGAAT